MGFPFSSFLWSQWAPFRALAWAGEGFQVAHRAFITSVVSPPCSPVLLGREQRDFIPAILSVYFCFLALDANCRSGQMLSSGLCFNYPVRVAAF